MIKDFNALLTLDIQFFAEGEPTPEPEGPTATPEPQPGPTPEPAKTFTQAELDEIIAKRIARVEKKYEGFDDLKTKASEYEKALEEKRLAELSEKERAEELAKKYEAEKQELAAQLEAIRKQAQEERIRNEFIKVASSANIIDVDAAIALSDLSMVEIGEDGKVNGVEDVIKALVENKPYLVAKKQAQPIGTATNGGSQSNDKSAEQLLADAAEKARSGGIKERMAYAKLKKELGK